MKTRNCTLWIAVALAVFTSGMNALGNDLVLHYDFEDFDGLTVVDRSAYQNDGVVYNATPLPGSPVGNAYLFDGATSYIEVPGDPSLALTNFTIAAWIRADALGAPSAQVLFQSMGFNASNGGLGFGFIGGYSIGFGARTATDQSEFYPPVFLDALDNGAWHFLVLTYRYEAGLHDAVLYLDGFPVYAATDAAVGPPAYAGQSAFIGTGYEGRARGFGFPREFQGAIADLKIYSRALDDTEVFDLSGETLDETLVLHYDFERYTGGTVYDQTTNRNDGVARILMPIASTPSGKGVEFNGVSSYIDVQGNPSFACSNLSITAWVRVDDHPIGHNTGIVSTEDFAAGNGGMAFFLGPSMQLGFAMRFANGTGLSHLSPPVFTPADNGTWHFLSVAYRYEGGEYWVTMYLDGLAVYAIRAAGPPIHYNGQLLIVGSNYDGRARGGCCARDLNGALADLKIFARALGHREMFEMAGQVSAARIYHAVEVCWPAVIGDTYQVQASSELTTGTWVNVGSPVTASNSFPCILDSTRDSPNKSYRIEILSP